MKTLFEKTILKQLITLITLIPNVQLPTILLVLWFAHGSRSRTVNCSLFSFRTVNCHYPFLRKATCVIFNLPELKTQVSFSKRQLSVVRLHVRRRLSVRLETFTFSSFSLERLDQFQLNLAQRILGYSGFKFV